MKKLLAVAVLGLVSVSANAAGSYVLSVVNSYNPFSGSGTSVLSGPLATGGTATVDGLGNFTTAGIQWSFINPNATFNYSGGAWSGVVGGTSVGKTAETCVQTAGVPCTSPVSGYLGIWATGVQSGGGFYILQVKLTQFVIYFKAQNQ